MNVDVEAIAERIEAATASTGMGFLLARLVVDELVSGALDPKSAEFDRVVGEHALELLLADRAADSATDRAYLAVLALAPEPGIPAGPVLAAAAAGLAPEAGAAAAGLPPEAEIELSSQLDFLQRFGRFVSERAGDGEPVYRLFHASVRDAVIDDLGGVEGESVGEMLAALLALRAEVEQPGQFLVESLPALIAEHGDVGLMTRAVRDATPDLATAQVEAIVRRAEEFRARGDWATARRLEQAAYMAGGTVGGVAYAIGAIAQARHLLVNFDMWREARDVGLGAIQHATRALDENPGSSQALSVLLQATRAYATAEGSGAFDAERGVYAVNEMLERAAEIEPGMLLAVADDLADLLQTYGDSLSWAAGSAVSRDAAAAASKIRGWLIEVEGREDLRVDLATSLVHEAVAGDGQVDARGLSRLREAGEIILGLGAMPPEYIWRVNKIIGELVQALGMASLHDAALDVLDRTLESYEPALRVARPTDGYPLSAAGALDLRSTVRAVLRMRAAAFEDAARSVELARAHTDSAVPLVGYRIALALRLIDDQRASEAVKLLEDPEPTDTIERQVLSLGRGLVDSEGGRDEEAREILEALLDELDPGEPVGLARMLSGRFASYGLELRVGLELAHVEERIGGIAPKVSGTARGALAFLRREWSGSPLRLLHLEPWLLEASLGQLRDALAPPRDALGQLEDATEPHIESWSGLLEWLANEGPDRTRADLEKSEVFDVEPDVVADAVEAAVAGDADRALAASAVASEASWPAVAALVIQLKILAAMRADLSDRLLEVASALRPGGGAGLVA